MCPRLFTSAKDPSPPPPPQTSFHPPLPPPTPPALETLVLVDVFLLYSSHKVHTTSMGGCESSEPAPASKARGPQAAPVRSTPQGAGVAASPKVKQGRPDKDEKSNTLKMARKQGDWPWSRPEPPDTKTGGFRGQRSKRGDFFYSKEYLSSFKILSATEARAYEAYCNDNHALARKILAEEACVPQDPVSPDDVDLDTFSPMARYSLGEGRVRGGSVAGVVTNTQALEASDGPRGERAPLSPHAANVVLEAVQNCPLFQHLSRNFGEHQIVAEVWHPNKMEQHENGNTHTLQEMKQLSLPAGDTVLVGGEYPRENRRGWYVVVAGKLHCAKGAHGATWTAKVCRGARALRSDSSKQSKTNKKTEKVGSGRGRQLRRAACHQRDVAEPA